MKKERPAHLRIVDGPPPVRPVADYDFNAAESQATLFVSKDPSLLIFASIESMAETEILSLFVNASPKTIVDLRLAPRFDFGSVTRRFMLSLFDTIGARYIALSANLGPKTFRDVLADRDSLVLELSQALTGGRGKPNGPVMLLVDSSQASDKAIEWAVTRLPPPSAVGWDLLRIPQRAGELVDPNRTLLFISHATPEDNEFVQWISTQLRIMGYDVWTDFGELRGGDVFWDQIEGTIRNRTSKVIAVLSTIAQQKNGFLDEINTAVTIERTKGYKNFVIPCRIDELPFDEVRANLARKNILDFARNWSAGLRMLVETLDRDRVPRKPAAVTAVDVIKSLEIRTQIQDKPESILLNWAELISYPKSISFYKIVNGGPNLLEIFKQAVPCAPYRDGILAFASPSDVAEHSRGGLVLRRDCAVLTAEFLKGEAPELPSLNKLVARNAFSSLVRQAWDGTMRRRQMLPYELASGVIGWYAPVAFTPSNRVAFTDLDGKKRLKSLVGYSAKRGVYWHFALEARLAQGYPLRLTTRPHVVFTTDGKTPIDSPARMHVLRRGFCRSWWNDRWRDLTVAFLAYLASDNSVIRLEAGATSSFELAGHLMQGRIAVSPTEVFIDDETVDQGEPIDEDLDDEEVSDLIIARDTAPDNADPDKAI